MAPASANHRMGPAEWGFLFALAFLWSSVFFLTKVALVEMRPFTVVALRLGIGAVVLCLAALATGARMPTSFRTWAAFFIMGGLNNFIPFCLIAYGQTQIASGLAAILNAATPLFTVLLAHVFTRDERITANRLAGVLIGVFGVAVMIGPGAMHGLTTNVSGQVAILGAAVCYACAGIFGRRFRGLPPLVTAAGQVTAGAAMVLPLSLFIDQPWARPMPGIIAWGAITSAALFCTSLGYALYFRILATAGATNLMLVTLLMPIGAVFLGRVILGEQLQAADFAGMGMIGAGLIAIDGRALALLKSRPLPATDQAVADGRRPLS
jgi:drug/metabolite transporter (DMT)-like permease